MANHKRGLSGARRRRRTEKRTLDHVDGRRVGYICRECGDRCASAGAFTAHLTLAHGKGGIANGNVYQHE